MKLAILHGFTIIFMMLFITSVSRAQDLEVGGKVKIRTMTTNDTASNVVVKLSNGSLGLRQAATLKGERGPEGPPGPAGINGIQGAPGIGLPTNATMGDMSFWNGSEWVILPAGLQNQTLHFCNGVPRWEPCFKDVYNPITGRQWMDRNLGAARVAIDSIDYLSYGHHFQWGRSSDGHEHINWISSTTTDGAEQLNETTSLSPTDTPGHNDFIIIPFSPFDWKNPQDSSLWQGVKGTNNPCPSGYRIPTVEEWNAERLSWGSSNAAGAFDSPLKLPLAGSRILANGKISSVGSSAFYWSSSVMNGSQSGVLYFFQNIAGVSSGNRANGYSVRCIKEIMNKE